jgi:hypothetical protein
MLFVKHRNAAKNENSRKLSNNILRPRRLGLEHPFLSAPAHPVVNCSAAVFVCIIAYMVGEVKPPGESLLTL